MSEQDRDLHFNLEEYVAALETWMREHGATAMREELHLDVESLSGTFWRSGYLQALQDLQALIRQRDSSDPYTQQGISKLFH